MTSCIIRKFAINQLNKLLDDYKDNIGNAKEKVWVWMKRADAINKFMQGLYEKLSDNNLTEDELKATLEELNLMVSKWKSV